MTLAFSLDRTIAIHARRATVFRFFTDSARWAKWWGAGSTIDPVVGGAVSIVYPTGDRASGTVREIVPDERIVFTYGYDAPGKSIAPGASLVTITLADLPGGATRLELRHDVADAATRDEHIQGWRHQLAVFASIVAEEAFAGATDAVATWFAAWGSSDARGMLAPIVATDVRFRDAYGNTAGLDELAGHIAAAQRFMPGVSLELRGKARRAHDVALADWAMVRDGNTLATGTNVFRFAPDGRIADVTGVSG